MTEGLVFGNDFVERLAAVGQHFGDMLTIVIAGIVESGERGGGDGGTRCSHLFAAVADASIAGIFAVVDIFLCAVDHFGSNGNPGVAAASEPLNLSDGRGAFIVVIAIASADVAPTAGGCLSFATKFDRLL